MTSEPSKTQSPLVSSPPRSPAPRSQLTSSESRPRLTESSQAAALLAPQGREQDWILSTEAGHLLLLSPGIARLIILIGDNPTNFSDSSSLACRKREDATYVKSLENSLKPPFFALFPAACAKDRIFYVPILVYEHNMISSVVLERCAGDFVGAMLVEDVEIESDSELIEFRRRLRFKRMSNLVRTEIRLCAREGF